MSASSAKSGRRNAVAKTIPTSPPLAPSASQLRAGGDECGAALGQARPGVRRGGEGELDAMRECVCPAPDRSQRSQALRVPLAESLQPRVDCLGSLEMEDGDRGEEPS